MRASSRAGRTASRIRHAARRGRGDSQPNGAVLVAHRVTCTFFSALGGIRTPNLLIRSQMLYPLSYERRTSESTGRSCRTPESTRRNGWRPTVEGPCEHAEVSDAGSEARPPTRAATMMGAATAASRGIGFIRIWAIATILGTTYLGNTYQSSSAVSNVLFELLAAGALSAVLVPTFVRHLEREDHAEAERLASGVLGLALVVLGVIALIGFAFAPQIARVIASGAPADLKAEQQSLAT